MSAFAFGRRAALALPALAAKPAWPQDAALTIGVGAPVTSIDPHFFNASFNSAVASHIFDRLTERTPDARLVPGLAESWRAVSDTVWEFRLRDGMRWHDGRPFTADDVAFTIERAPRVPNSPGGFGVYLRAITRTEVVDARTIRLHSARPHPIMPSDLAFIPIIARHAATGATTEDFNSGRAAIGTGPYRFVSFRAGDRIELARNDAYWGGAQPWARVHYRMITNDSARLAAVLAGDVDVIDQVPSADIARVRREGRVTLAETLGARLIFLAPDFSRREAPAFITDAEGRPLAQNPLLDLRVRQALSAAIDRAALAERVMEGTARAAGQWLPAGPPGHNPEVPPPLYDPDAARRLLFEAGYPQGFRITLHTPNDRYPNDARTAQAVAQMWTRVGVRTDVAPVPWASFPGRAARQEFAMHLIGWGSSAGDPIGALMNVVGSFDRSRSLGAVNHHRYANPALDAHVERALATMDDAARNALLREAVRMAADDVAVIPLYNLVNAWAARRGLTVAPRLDERTLAMDVRPA
ncbi:ABC transporter substrate-binding protein [Roseomonas sp. PWR1]|uniref:ABC transporter substrate-binding protein n=1 Tax=Roseomonas nitratireducens TaxID=2820810 RepID=A0ABS4AVP2_9PROT|nr:ABC transporter substrate-binding protein [Neoroseomonas nitratireducens]MBP0465438.1 ABC transporter substrate-binding protein [Neoroseomonas nitratireducens]